MVQRAFGESVRLAKTRCLESPDIHLPHCLQPRIFQRAILDRIRAAAPWFQVFRQADAEFLDHALATGDGHLITGDLGVSFGKRVFDH